MYSYFIPVLAAMLVMWACFILFHAACRDRSGARVEIIIDADGAQELEGLVMTAKNVAQKYFDNADIYIRGGDERYSQIVCRAHGITKI